MNTGLNTLSRLLAAAVFTLCLSASTLLAADIVTAWNDNALQVIRHEKVPPPRASRGLAMTHLAIWSAMNADQTAPRRTSTAHPAPEFRDAAACCAARDVLVALFPADQDFCDQALAASLADIPEGPAKTRGIAAGRRVAQALILARANDGADVVVDYTPGDLAGQWRPTPPGFLPALLPNWGNVTPFAMTSGAQFRVHGLPALDSAEYAAALNEVQSLGSKANSTRTPDETEVALFWADGGGTATPPGHWNAIAHRLAEQFNLTPEDDARLFAALNVALADAAIAAWDMKYSSNFWRPVTAIRLADTDGNPGTGADPAWEPLLVTPPFPTYVSGHSTFSGAAATVLAHFFGGNDIPFSTTSEGLPGVTRSFGGFWQAAEEAGQSRVYGGIHFQFDNRDGLASGRAIGEWVWQNLGRVRIQR